MVLDPVTLGVGAALAGRLLYRWLKETPRPPKPPKPAPPAPRRPAAKALPYFDRLSGAHPTSAEAVEQFLSEQYPSPLTMSFGGVKNWPVERYMNKFLFLTGVPGSGKTAFERLMLKDQARLFNVDGFRLRWLITDPTNAYLPYLFQILPPHVPIIRAAPQDADGQAWDVAADVGTDEEIAIALIRAFFPDQISKASEPFWITKAAHLCLLVVMLFIDRESPWRLADLVRLLVYPQFLSAFLMQSARTRGAVEFDLVDKMGKGIIATASAQINQLAIAASCMEHAKRQFSFSGAGQFLDTNSVLHFGYTPQGMHSCAMLASAMVNVLALHAYKRNDEHNHTVLWGDEGRFLGDLPIETINARGRGSGLSVVLSSVGIPALLAKWSEERVREMIDGVFTWITFSVGHQTAKEFCDLVGEVEGVQRSWTHSSGSTSTWGRSYSLNSLNWWMPTGYNESHSQNYSNSTTYSLHTKPLVKPSELTGLPQGDALNDRLELFLFNRDIGCLHAETPFLHCFRDLPPAPFAVAPARPAAHSRLRPFRADDIRRLNLDLTPAMIAALKTVEDYK